MCVKKPKIPQARVAPPPTQVQPDDVKSEENTSEQERRRRGRGSTELSTDRDSILGSVAGGGGRNTLG